VLFSHKAIITVFILLCYDVGFCLLPAAPFRTFIVAIAVSCVEVHPLMALVKLAHEPH